MGWTGIHAEHHKKDGTVDRKAELDHELFGMEGDGGHKLLKSSMVGNTYYAAVKHPDGHVYGLVVLTSVDSSQWFDFHYKDMTENMGPFEAKCPASILKLLSPTEDENALDWRKRCREHTEARKSPTAPANLPIGARIQVSFGKETLELVKCAPAYQFKRPFWYIPDKGKYLSAKRIPKDYKVISA